MGLRNQMYGVFLGFARKFVLLIVNRSHGLTNWVLYISQNVGFSATSFHLRFHVIRNGESRVLRDAVDVGVSACAPTARRNVRVSASQTGERFHQGCDECSMNNTLPPKGKCLKVVDIIDSLLCPFLCLHLCRPCVKERVSARRARFRFVVVGVRE